LVLRFRTSLKNIHIRVFQIAIRLLKYENSCEP
jgi:hypothetical protein